MNRHPGTFVAGVVFVVIGVIYFIDALGGWTVNPARLWPVVLIAIGVTVLLSSGRRRTGTESSTPEIGSAGEPPAD